MSYWFVERYLGYHISSSIPLLLVGPIHSSSRSCTKMAKEVSLSKRQVDEGFRGIQNWQTCYEHCTTVLHKRQVYDICMDTIAASIAAQNTPNNITKHMQLAKYPAVGPKEN